MNKIRFKKLLIITIIVVFNFWLHLVFVAAHQHSLVVASKGYSSLWLLYTVASLVAKHSF